MNTTLILSNSVPARGGVVWINSFAEKRPFAASFFAAAGIHAALFLIGGILFNTPPEYGMQFSQGGMDIELVAAPAAIQRLPPSAAEMPKPQESNMIETTDDPAKSLETSETVVPVNSALSSKVAGDGSSVIEGKDATTLSSSGSGQTSEKPGYLKNPPPPYPSEAIRKEQEGLVMLSVWVSRSGEVQSVEISQSSGVAVLDQSALKAVRKWKFKPARSGALAIESRVNIPVRFRLEDVRHRPKEG